MASTDPDEPPTSFDAASMVDAKPTIDVFVTGNTGVVREQFHARLDSQRAHAPVFVGLPGRPARPPPPQAAPVPHRLSYSQRKGFVRDKDLLTLAEALNDDVPRNCAATRLLWKAVDKLEFYVSASKHLR